MLCIAGESVPVTKTPIAEHCQVAGDSGGSQTFHIKEHSRHVLFCGTHVIQTRYYEKQRVRAVVIRTGASSDYVRLVPWLHAKYSCFKIISDFVDVRPKKNLPEIIPQARCSS